MKTSGRIRSKKRKFIVSSVLTAALVIALTTFIILIGYELDWKLDLTEQKLFTLTQDTIEVMDTLDTQNKNVRIAAIYETDREEAMVAELLREYEKKSDHISVEYIDAEKNPEGLAAYDLGDVQAVYNGSLIVECDNRIKIIQNGNMFQNLNGGQIFYGEREITGAIRYVTAETLPVIYFTSGHGEVSAGTNLTKLTAELKRQAYDTKTLVMLQDGIPEDADIIVMVSPKEDISKAEQDLLKGYMDKGGKLMLFTDPFLTSNTQTLDNLNAICGGYGIDISNNYVVEENSSYYLTTNNMYLIPRFSSHEITAAIGEAERMVILPLARGLGAVEYDEQNTERSILLLSSDKAWARNDMKNGSANRTAADIEGPVVLGFAGRKSSTAGEEPSRLVVYGDSDFAADENYDVQANSTLCMNSVNWLLGGRELDDISGKSITTTSLLVRGDTFVRLMIICCFVMPFIAFACAFFVWRSERNR